jgi:hypothetical protein
VPTRKVGSTLQPLTIDVTLPTDVQLNPGSIEGVFLRVCEATQPYLPVGEFPIPTDDWSLAGTAPDQVLTLTWFEPLEGEPLSELEYLGEVRVLASTGRELLAPNDGYIHLRLQEALSVAEES